LPPTQQSEVAAPDQERIYRAALRLRLDELDAQFASRIDPTPGHLALRLDPLSIQTPALDLIDQKLIGVRDAIAGMYERRQRLAELKAIGLAVDLAIERAAHEIPSVGIERLLVSIPPQEGKSTRISRIFALWMLRQFPRLRIGIVSYDGEIAAQFSYMIRADVETFGPGSDTDLGLRMARDQRAMSRWQLESGATVYAIGIGGGLAGRPIDLLLIDDPVKDQRAADSVVMSSAAWVWWQTIARPRLAPWAPVVLVSTRWHEADMIGRVLAKQAEDESEGSVHFDTWDVVNIPAQADHNPDKGETDVLGRAPGEFMISARGRTKAQWEATKTATAPRYWTALYQGRPTPDVGDIWLRTWWRRYDTPLWERQSNGTYLLPGYDVTQSWDFAFGKTSDSDYVAGQVWAKRGADSYLVYQVWSRLSFTDSIAAIRRVTRLFPQARRKVIENKANGPAVIDSLKHEIPGIIPANPYTSKVSRATAVSPYIRAGNVHLPTSNVATMELELAWDPEALIVEATSFPNGQHDDMVDSVSQYLEEAYITGGQAIMTAPGRAPVRSIVDPGLSPIQRRISQAQRKAIR
jgi:predicted phage terminase large subunit-like protein